MVHPGRVVRNVRLVRKLGRGGMGEVWLGHDQKLGRDVAVKAIREERLLDSHAKARFLREARLLSKLDHRSICRILDYVEEEDAEFIVLEMIEGETLSHRLHDRLPASAALDIAIQIADALTAAHAMSVVHRDLKPDNVMLTPDGTAKVLDFGLARSAEAQPLPAAQPGPSALEPDDPEETVERSPDSVTRLGEVMGTPRYMSPEQARGEAVTAASDMYAFGLLLQEMLTGESPYETGLTPLEVLHKASWGDRRPVRKGKPAAITLIDRLTSIEPGHRPSASATAEELRRIREAPRQRRRRLARVAGVLLLAALTVALAILAVRVRLEADRATAEAEVARETTDFLVSLFEVADPRRSEETEVTAAELLERGTQRIRTSLQGQPRTRARLLGTMGMIYANIGSYGDGAGLLEEALALEEERPGPDSAELVGPLRRLASVYLEQGRLDEAEALLERARIAVVDSGDDDRERAEVLHDLLILRLRQARLAEAEEAGRQALELRERILGPDDPDTALTAGMLGLAVLDAGRYAEAEPLLQRALQVQQRHLPQDHPQVVFSLVNLATARKELGRYAEAEGMYREAVTRVERRLGPEHPSAATARNDLAVTLTLQGRHADAEVEYRRAAEIAEQALGAGHPYTGIFLGNLGEARHLGGHPEEALPLYRRALAIVRGALGDTHPVVAEVLRGMAAVEADLGRHDDAEALLEEAITIRENALGPDHPELARALAQLGGLLAARERTAEARTTLRRAILILEAAFGPDDAQVKDLRTRLAELPPAAG